MQRKSIYKLALIILGVLLLYGCITPPIMESTNQKIIEAIINQSKLVETLKSNIPKGSAISLIALDENTELNNVSAYIEGKVIETLMNNGYSVLERTPKMVKQIINEKENNNLSINIDRDVRETHLMPSDYTVSYRVLQCKLDYRKKDRHWFIAPFYDLANFATSVANAQNVSEPVIVEGFIKLYLRIQDTKTGKIVMANDLDSKFQDIIDTYPSLMKNFEYTYIEDGLKKENGVDAKKIGFLLW